LNGRKEKETQDTKRTGDERGEETLPLGGKTSGTLVGG
jgi:hypothetical protein